MELICPAGTPAALRSAIEAGADAVYCGFNDETNARNFPGLNFSRDELRKGIAFAHDRGARILVAINTFPRASATALWQRAVDDAVEAGADALIVADIGLMDYVARRHPNQRLHVSVQAAAANPDVIAFYVETFRARRVVLPRVLSVVEIAEIIRETTCETEVFVFGGLCVMAEGRCSLSSYATGKSPNMQGVCSPASHVAYEETAQGTTSRLGGFTINRFAPQEAAGYPTLCKGRFSTALGDGYIFEDPVSLDATTLLRGLQSAGVAALKIEGRQRGRAYIESVVRHFRRALDTLEDGSEADIVSLKPFTEGQASTLGAYRKTWR
ncbi:ubiquinone anaerobic biosynthesis protein UbiU [Bradyrhizobium sp. CCBAU 51627]|uniref:ubiquinone anaerobic biosynthesis protein UbiU n=1 Tax=Bradyrhizobium sp. CCBAU 51627 TaxID=1325088 RepID=UPI002305251B|nr:peptidase U32 family protein [Bradyrhizobium sp. CCBAU 51627]MDA9432412.1 protease [Bradyrhizobium sp. CCBAU 51627]